MEADRLADGASATAIYNVPGPVQLRYKGKTVTSKIRWFLHESYSKPIYKRYLNDKYDWTESQFRLIDWKITGSAMHSFSSADKT